MNLHEFTTAQKLKAEVADGEEYPYRLDDGVTHCDCHRLNVDEPCWGTVHFDEVEYFVDGCGDPDYRWIYFCEGHRDYFYGKPYTPRPHKQKGD